MDASIELGILLSAIQAAFNTSNLAPCHSASICNSSASSALRLAGFLSNFSSTPSSFSSSRDMSSAARDAPIAIAATGGRVLSKVCMTPPNAFLRPSASVASSALPRILVLGILQSLKLIAAVSDARMPSLCSSRVTSHPGVPFSTMKDLMAALPSDLSSVAQTTSVSERSPSVTYIFSPLSTHSSPSATAVVLMLAESEPVPGSVIHIAA